ncbi:MAG: hypothetical protein COS34_04995 [Lysobacterales bacterium CG02_land_8_20_14_3_00_62_12]|nr:MAG: hypothetical protein COS34_04995 [Xanthomonadales bacterium CG02_land_8_20_14_3_00_62_12]
MQPAKPIIAAHSRIDYAGWVLAASGLLLVLHLKLLAALIAGLLVYELSMLLLKASRVRGVSSVGARWIASALLILIVGGLIALAVFGLVGFLRNGGETVPALLQKMAEIIESAKDLLPSWALGYLPANAVAMQAALAQWLRDHATVVQLASAEVGRAAAHILIGMVVGGLLALSGLVQVHAQGPLTAALNERGRRLRRAFRNIVVAQSRIALINAVLTWLYLGVLLPLSGIQLPLVKTMVVVTFIVGLLPVVGNLVSNTVIVIVSLSHSLEMALVSLIYLVLIHKLEYFLNARIIGARIEARAWELLIAMLIMEAAFGIPGLVAAPIYYAYLKTELRAEGLV